MFGHFDFIPPQSVLFIILSFTSVCAGVERIMAMDTLHSQQRNIGWGLGAAQGDRLSKQAMPPGLIRLYQLLLFTMPGTPVFTYGDEIGLQAVVSSTADFTTVCVCVLFV